MPLKDVRVICHEPIAAYNDYKQGWCDVWLRFKLRRKTIRKGPTLISRHDLRRCIANADRFAEVYADDEDFRNLYLQSAKEYRGIDMLLDTFGCWVEDKDEGCHDVYTSADMIDNAEARRMIAFLLSLYGVEKHKQRWKRPGGMLVVPVSL